MNHYYVSAARGSDSNGTGTATSPWKTINKAIGTTPGVSLGVNGARVFIEPGTYYEAVTLGLSPSAGAPLEIIGDCDGAGFYGGGYATPETGIVDWSAWSSNSASIALACLNSNGKSFVTLRRIKMYGGSTLVPAVGSCVHVGSGTNWTLTDCTFIPHQYSTGTIWLNPTGSGANLTVERCDIYLGCSYGSAGLRIEAPETAVEYDLASVARNCRFFVASSNTNRGVRLVRTTASGLGSLGRGLSIEYCAFYGFSIAVSIWEGVSIATSAPCPVVGCVFFLCEKAIVAGATSHIAEDWNVFHCLTPRTNVSIGTNSSATARPTLDFEDGRFAGVPLRPYGTPTPGSPIAGFVGGGTPPVKDFAGRNRPEGLGSTNASAGPLERHDTGERNIAYADAGSTACLALTGPSSLERPILLDATATTISLKVRWDGNHGDAKKPQVMLLANPEIGVTTDQLLTATTTAGVGTTPNSYETMTFASFTPTKAGARMLRLVSRSATGNGVAYFDSITLS